MSGFLSIDVITHHVMKHFQDQEGTTWSVDSESRIQHMPWSELYFVNLYNAVGAKRRVVVKMFRFPEQTQAEISWESEELQIRGQREYKSMTTIHEHFKHLPDSRLSTITPIAYLPTINAIVMEFIEGKPLYDTHLKGLQINLPEAAAALHGTGQWLAWLHQLPDDNVDHARKFHNKDALDNLYAEIEQLQQLNVSSPEWLPAIEKLAQLPDTNKVWCHCDFHLRNVLVKPDQTLLGFDTALERYDSPYFDIGKLIADLQTRRSRILYRGLIPSQKTIDKLSLAFLSGYFGDQANPDEPELLLYEGRFLFQKWRESLEQMQDTLSSSKPLYIAGNIIRSGIVNPTFHSIIDRWLNRVMRNVSI